MQLESEVEVQRVTHNTTETPGEGKCWIKIGYSDNKTFFNWTNDTNDIYLNIFFVRIISSGQATMLFDYFISPAHIPRYKNNF